MLKNEQRLRELARNDPGVYQLLQAYDAGYFESWEDFLIDCIVTLAAMKNSLQDRLLENIKRQGPPPIVLEVSPDEAKSKVSILIETLLKR